MAFDDTFVRDRIGRAAQTIARLESETDSIVEIGRAVRGTLAGGGTVLTCGNGGSAAEALHLSEELMGKYRKPRRPFASVCLNADPTALTCIANDYGFEFVFSRQVEGLGRPGDVLVVFTTSGNSANILRALETAKERGIATIGLLGKDGGACKDLCDKTLIVPSQETEAIQEAHQVVLHLILEAVEA